LFGSLPEKVVLQLKETKRLFEREITQARVSPTEIAELKLKHHKRLFAKIDAVLDRAAFGPRWLENSGLATLIEDVLLQRYADLYSLWAYVVMTNHIHLLLRPKLTSPRPEPRTDSFVPLSVITKSIKGYSAREANRV